MSLIRESPSALILVCQRSDFDVQTLEEPHGSWASEWGLKGTSWRWQAPRSSLNCTSQSAMPSRVEAQGSILLCCFLVSSCLWQMNNKMFDSRLSCCFAASPIPTPQLFFFMEPGPKCFLSTSLPWPWALVSIRLSHPGCALIGKTVTWHQQFMISVISVS